MMGERVGFIGLGRMGAGMAANLVAAEVPLLVYDRDANALQTLVDAGAEPAANPAVVAAKVDHVFLCLPDAPQVDAVLFGESGVLDAARAPLSIVDTTTMNHGAVLEIAERARAAGHCYSDCPISGMPFRANQGTLTMMFGGEAHAFSAVRSYLEIMGEFIVHCGSVGTGQLMKALNNIVYNINIAGICEVMPLAVKAGIAPATVAKVMTTASASSFASQYFVPRILARRFDSDFPMAAAYKDIVNVKTLAARENAPTPVVDAMVKTYDAAMALGLGEEPKSAMVKVYERTLGVELHGQPEAEEDPKWEQ